MKKLTPTQQKLVALLYESPEGLAIGADAPMMRDAARQLERAGVVQRVFRLAPEVRHEIDFPVGRVVQLISAIDRARTVWDPKFHAHLCPDCFDPLPADGSCCDECGWTLRADGLRRKSERTTAAVLDERARRRIALERAEGARGGC